MRFSAQAERTQEGLQGQQGWCRGHLGGDERAFEVTSKLPVTQDFVCLWNGRNLTVKTHKLFKGEKSMESQAIVSVSEDLPQMTK